MAPSLVTPSSSPEPTPVKVLILGGSYAGLSALTALLDLSHGRRSRYDFSTDPVSSSKFPLEITLVDERDGYMHLIGTPLALADREFMPKAWVRYEDMPQWKTAPGLRFIHGSVEAVDAEKKSAKITKFVAPGAPKKVIDESYDYLVVATGLRRVWPTVPDALTKEGYLAECTAHLDQVSKATKGVVVIGGGAVGIEIAAELKMTQPNLNVTLIHSRARLLSSEPLPDTFASEALGLLQKMAVNVRLSCRVTSTTPISASPPLTQLTLCNGETLDASVVVWAISRQHATGSIFLPPSAVNPEGYVNVNKNLSIQSLPSGHFCIGDVINWKMIRRAGAAMWMGGMAAHNIHQRILVSRGEIKEGEIKDKELIPIPPMMGLAVGLEAVGYSEAEGIKVGEEVRRGMFGDDLGWSICWNYMRLGEEFKA